MKFAIRDDDTSYFTSPEELTAAYGQVWNDIPVSLAVIPYDVPSFHRGIPEKFRQEAAPVSIEENQPLVRRLRSLAGAGHVNIMLHGYNHLYSVTEEVPFDSVHWQPEFTYADDLRGKVARGKALLEKLFGVRVSSFVPPSNAISSTGLRALAESRLNLAGVARPRTLVSANPLNLALMAAVRAHPRYPYSVRHYIGHKQIQCHSLTPSCKWESLSSHLHECARKNGAFVVATHYWEREATHPIERSPLGEMLMELIERGRRLGAEFVTVDQIFAE